MLTDKQLWVAARELCRQNGYDANKELEMSSFKCEQCGKDIIDTPTGYVTGCEHYLLPVVFNSPTPPVAWLHDTLYYDEESCFSVVNTHGGRCIPIYLEPEENHDRH